MPIKTLQFKDEVFTQNTLGMSWCSLSDCLKFNSSLSDEVPEKLTRRVILSFYSKIFYPLGFVQPFMLNLKLIIQEQVVWASLEMMRYH